MKNKEESSETWVKRIFPTQKAREAADKATDVLAPSESMSAHLDTWIAAYRNAGGVEP